MEIDQLIDAAVKWTGPGERSPALPPLPADVRATLASELTRSEAMRAAYAKLDAASRRNVEWFDAVAELERLGAAAALVSCLWHPSDDVQLRALRSLRRLGDPSVVPALLTYADAMAVYESGSENATLHGMIHEELATTLSSLTGIRVDIHGQDPQQLREGIRRWRQWQEDRARPR